jgi:glycosidase
MGLPRVSNHVAPDTELLGTYQELIALRKDNLRLFVDGEITWLLADDANSLVAYGRDLGDQHAIIAFNASDDVQDMNVEAEDGVWRTAFAAGGQAPETVEVAGGYLAAELPPLSARVWILVGK